jgi:hypothetical protein
MISICNHLRKECILRVRFLGSLFQIFLLTQDLSTTHIRNLPPSTNIFCGQGVSLDYHLSAHERERTPTKHTRLFLPCSTMDVFQILVFYQRGAAMDLDYEFFCHDGMQPAEEDFYLRVCLYLATWYLLYVSFLLHESLLYFFLARCRRKLEAWRGFIKNFSKRSVRSIQPCG